MTIQSKNHLVLLNFVLDTDNALLSHQAEVVRSLARSFTKVTVITGQLGKFDRPGNVEIINLQWVEGKNFRNLLRLYKAFFSALKPGGVVVFSHMTDVQSAFLSPITWISGTPHYLWYAHKQLSPYLRFASYFVNGILTSTPGSCPLTGQKIFVIGQGVDSSIFEVRRRLSASLDSCIHIGRADPSKNLNALFDFAEKEHSANPKFRFVQVGEPSTLVSNLEFQKLCREYQSSIDSGVIELRSSKTRSQVPDLLASAEVFVHAYEGSLDKSLIESTLARLPVVTLNAEYHTIFGRWGNSETPTLQNEYEGLRRQSAQSLQQEIERRFKLAVDSHSFSNWIVKITNILENN